MFLSVYRFAGEPVPLAAAHARMLAQIPPSNIELHFAVPHPGGLDVYDGCPTREVAEAFSGSEAFAGLLKAVGLPTEISDIPGELPPTEVLMDAIAQDKKVKSGKLTFILTRGIGQSFVADDVPASEVISFLREKHP